MGSTNLKSTYVIDASAFDENNNKAIIIETYSGSQTVKGGQVLTTNRTTVS